MLVQLRRIGRDSALYLLSQVLATAVSFLLIPVYTRILTPRDYGVIALVESMTGIFSILFQLGLVGAVGRFYFDFYRKPEGLSGYLGTIVRFLLPYSLVSSFVVALLGRPLLQPLLGEVPFRPFVWLALAIAVGEVFFALTQTLHNVREQAARFLSFSVTAFLLNLSLVLYFVVLRRAGALGNTTARLISSLLLLAVAFYLMRRDLAGPFDRGKLKASLQFGLPLVPHALSSWIVGGVDRLFLNHYAGLGGVGVYALGFKVGNLMNLVTVAINYAWAPFFLRTAQEKGEEAKPLFARLTSYYVAAICFLGLLLALPAREMLVLLVPAEYHAAHRVVPIITFGWVISGLYYMVVNQIFFVKKTKFLPLATFSAGLFQLLLNYLLTPRFGLLGSAWAMLLAQLSAFFMTWYLSHRVYPMRFEHGRIGKAALATAGLVAVSQVLPPDSIAVSLVFKGMLLLLYPVLLVGMGFFSAHELAGARQVLALAPGRIRAAVARRR